MSQRSTSNEVSQDVLYSNKFEKSCAQVSVEISAIQRVGKIRGKWERDGKRKREQERPTNKGHHTIYKLDISYIYSTMFLCSVVRILSLKLPKHSNRAVTCIKYSNHTVRQYCIVGTLKVWGRFVI